MEYKIIVPYIAELDIKNIADNVFRFTFSKDSSQKIYDKIYSSIYSLKIFPLGFSQFNDTLRVLVVNKSYKIFYEVDEVNNTVIILRVLGSSQNTENFSFTL